MRPAIGAMLWKRNALKTKKWPMMNENFINIKIDREERPDVDQIYMDAIQMMSGNGGWPLNIVALPDGRPFWGATYVPKDNWVKSLKQLN